MRRPCERSSAVLLTCFFCSSCHKNEMSRLGHTETIPSATPGMAGLRARRLGGKHSRKTKPIGGLLYRAKQTQTWVDWGIWGTAREGSLL